MVKLYAVNSTPLTNDTTLATALTRLDPQRAAQVARQRQPQKQAQQAAAGLLLTHLFGENGQPPRLAHGSRGKPYLADNRAFFNLSHTGDWVVCAVADSEIGVDAQLHGICNDKVVARCFTSSEVAWLNDDRDGRFSRLWTYKEAYIKFTGFGLVLPMSSFTVPTPPDGWDDENHVCWKEYSLSDNTPVHIAVCCGNQTDFAPLTILPLAELL